jgi:phenylalanyl-tRNA synthetase beta chain
MKFSEKWLRELVNPKMDVVELSHQLTMIGHEVNSIELQGANLDDVVIAEIISVDPHPNADRLSICHVSTGKGKPIKLVCGAPNVAVNMKSPLAVAGVRLADGTKLGRLKIRGVESNGMLCSAIELGLGDEADGIIAFPNDAPTGLELSKYLGLPDNVLDIDLTPNRGDCFSIFGVARDVAAMTGIDLTLPDLPSIPTSIENVYPIEIADSSVCPRFVGRVVCDINPCAKTPTWMTERLRRSGFRTIHPVVDISNYVMLELGQPLHAYDLALLKGAIKPRFAKKNEKITLLDEREVHLSKDTLVITDDSGPIGLAGIMGGLSTAVSETTKDVFFEAAFWPTSVIAGRARSYRLHTDASLRFERGVDFEGQARAVERATELLIGISGGDPGPLVDLIDNNQLPLISSILLRKSRLKKILGVDIPNDRVVEILENLGLNIKNMPDGWEITPPSFRFDLVIEEDLIEEVARIYGYDQIPEITAKTEVSLGSLAKTTTELEQVATILAARDYQEIVTYSFIDAEKNQQFTGEVSELVLSNPISSEMSVMRGSLWPGMIEAAGANTARQQDRIRFFEIGKSFHGTLKKPIEVVRVAGLALGSTLPEQWGARIKDIDLFDVKSDLETVLKMATTGATIDYDRANHPVLQSGQTANIMRNGHVIGVFGKLHPTIGLKMNLDKDIFLFELDAGLAFTSNTPRSANISKYPAIRRDIAIVVDDKIAAADLIRVASSSVPDIIQKVTIFDVYRGAGIEIGRKSIALGLILQETSRTLTEADADSVIDTVVRNLKQKFKAELRD